MHAQEERKVIMAKAKEIGMCLPTIPVRDSRSSLGAADAQAAGNQAQLVSVVNHPTQAGVTIELRNDRVEWGGFSMTTIETLATDPE